MAITIDQTPESFFMPVYNDIIFIIESDNVAQENFSYIADVYVSGVFAQRMKIKADPVANKGIIQINGILEDYITTFEPDLAGTAGFVDCSGSYVNYQVKFGEEYGPDSSITEYPDLEESSVTYCYNGSLSFLDTLSVGGGSFTLTSTTRYLLTLHDTSYRLYRDQYDYLCYLSQISPAIQKMIIETYSNTGSLIATHEFTSPFSGQAGMFMVPAGYNLNNVDPSYHTSGPSPVIDDSVSSMRIYFVDNGGTRRSQYYTATFSEKCSPFDQYDLLWLNRAGGWDSFRFRRITDEKVTNEKKRFTKTIYTMSGGGEYSRDVPARGSNAYYISSTDIWTLRSDWMNDEESKRMRDLYDSGFVTLWDGTNRMAVDIDATEYARKKTETGQLIMYEVTVKFSNLNYRQRA